MVQKQTCDSCGNDAVSKCKECNAPLCNAHEMYCQLYCAKERFCKKHVLECEKCDNGFGFTRCAKCDKRFVHDHDK